MSPELRRPLVVATALTALGVLVPVVVQLGAATRVTILTWALLSAAFLVCALGSLASARRGVRRWLLAAAAGSTLGIVAVACDGFEGALLVLVAAQLGGLMSRRAALGWVIAQSLLLAAAIAWHWNARAAVLLGPPYAGFQLLALFMAHAVASTTTARGELARANAELRAAHAVLAENARLAERLRIARDLHDAAGHQLTALGIHLEVASKLATDGASHEIALARGLARASLASIRDLVDRLRDDERVDVASALQALAEETIAPRVHVDAPRDVCRDDPQRALAVLRCAQEIVTNARRHSGAANLWLAIAVADGALQVSARDDGVGAEPVTAGNGLRGMRERIEAAGGRLDIVSARGRGFEVRASLPARRAAR